jgi:hypothetical protein
MGTCSLGSRPVSVFGDIPAIRRFGTWSTYLLGFYGFAGLTKLGAGMDDLSPGNAFAGANAGILLSNAVWVAGMVVTVALFRRSCTKSEQAGGTRMNPAAVLCTGVFVTGALTLLATTTI